jgi:hypothetical protein
MEMEEMDQKEGESSEVDQEKSMGCAPYLQIFKAGKLIYTTAATLHVQQSDEELPFVQVLDGTVPFNIEHIIQGDILIRCRHLTFSKQRVSMFRAAFHTGYVPPNVLRLTKSQLDGACTDKRYPDDFFLDLIFEKVDAETATKHLKEQEEEEAQEAQDAKAKGKGPVVKASSFDTMLHGDSRFWDVIATKRQEQAKQKNKDDDDPMWGPTIGRRRGENTKKEQKGDEKDGKDDGVPPNKERTQFETFSIGNEFDFLPASPTATAAQAAKPEKDDLMDALNALDEDEGAHGPHENETEEIVFDTSASKETSEAKATSDPAFALAPAAEGDASQDTTTTPPPTTTTTTQPADDSSSKPEPKELTPAPSQASSEDDVEDIDAFLASADEDFGDMNLDDFDMDDDLDDLEAMLKT